MTPSDVQKIRTAVAVLRGYAENEVADGLLDVVEAEGKRNVANLLSGEWPRSSAWISVKEERPHEGAHVRVVHTFAGARRADPATFRGGRFLVGNEDFAYVDVTHWRLVEGDPPMPDEEPKP